MKPRRVAITSSIFGPSRFTIESSTGEIAVQTRGENLESKRFLFSFTCEPLGSVSGYVAGNVGILHFNAHEAAWILPSQLSTSVRMRYRAGSVLLGHVRYQSCDLPITCTLLCGLCGTNFVLRDQTGARLAFWRRSGRRVDVLLSRTAESSYSLLVLGTVLYLDMNKQ